jgi:5-methyltetrahydropteroyltriglutamate--homocysteine methyltransferase
VTLPLGFGGRIVLPEMEVRTGNHSSFPRIPASTEQQDPLEAAVRAQIACGVDQVTDGGALSPDPISGLLGAIDGAVLGERRPTPFADTTYRQPRIQAKLRHRRTILAQHYERAARIAGRALKVSLVGPYTLAHLSQIETTAYRGIASLASDLSAILADEVRGLVARGARLIQIDEPMILRSPQDIRLLRELLEPLQTAVEPDATLAVSTYGADAEPLYAQLNSLPGNIVAIDCADHPAMIAAVEATGSGKILALGLLDGRRATTETIDSRVALFDRATSRYGHATITIQPSCGLDAVTPQQAADKLCALVDLRRRIDGSGA